MAGFGKIFRKSIREDSASAPDPDDLQIVLHSRLFDPEWYAQRYGVQGRNEDLARHFLNASGAAARDPGPEFSTRFYLTMNTDVANSGANALVHYEQYGRAERRQTAASADGHSAPADKDLALVTAQFDPAFYRATNTDLAADEDLLAHFMARGWREGRDPCREFSTDFYLAANPDVRARNLNPFVHYLREGRAEGRYSRPSRAPVRIAAEPGPADLPTADLRCGVVALVRNEIDIIKPFVEHLLALFDDIVLIDHRSDDGTLEFLQSVQRASPRVRVLQFDEAGYHQALVINHVLRSHDPIADMDWQFMLDADEFLPFKDREAFHAALTGLRDAPVISMRWSNVIPASYWEFDVDQVSGTAVLLPDQPGDYVKVAFQPGKIDRARAWAAQGYHSLIRPATRGSACCICRSARPTSCA